MVAEKAGKLALDRIKAGLMAILASSILQLSVVSSPLLLQPALVWANPPEGPLIPGLEEDIEEDVEEDVAQDLDQDIEDQIDEQVEANLDDSLEENVESEIAEDIEDRIEENIEEGLELTVEQTVEDDVEARIEADLEQVVEATVEDSVERTVEFNLTEFVERYVEESVESGVESALEDSIEETVEEAVESAVEEGVEEAVAEAVEESVEEAVEESVASVVEDSVETAVEESVEEAVQASIEANIEVAVEDEIATTVETGVEESVESTVESSVAEAVEDRLEGRIDRILDDIESEFDVDEKLIQKDQWLVMAEPEVFDELAEEGYLFDSVTDLPGLGLRLAEVAAPSSFDINEVRRGVLDVVGKERADVDLNHIYTAGIPQEFDGPEEGIPPRLALSFPADTDQLSLRIGMIDSRVDTSHPALNSGRIQTRSFTPEGAELPAFHGTAVASIIAADDGDYRGLAPHSELYAAEVFENDAERGEIASTVSLVRAVDWLMSAGVDVVNISLAGPPNRLLETALRRAAQHKMLLLAAAGNGGPVAQPMFPAAYDTVVAVTAVDVNHQVFRLANRGDYLDLAAPGVGLVHARAGGGYATSSGTSFAVPFAATAAARLRQLHPEQDALATLFSLAEDLGPPGRDDIYGRGLLRP